MSVIKIKVAIHQPHYFPWLGYFHKMASVDTFVLLDQVQFVKSSNMIRNRVLDNNGEIKYMTISGDTKGFLDKGYRELKTKDVSIWTKRQLDALKNYYRGSEYCSECLSILVDFFSDDKSQICDWTCGSIELCKKILGIETKIVYQSDIGYDKNARNSDLVLDLCKRVGANYYMSGRGASVQYLDREKFLSNGVETMFQNYCHPIYCQVNSQQFVKGLSLLDVLFNCGKEGTKNLFWDSVKKSNWSKE